MDTLFNIISMCLLGVIFYQDLKFKAVTWIIFPIVAIVFIVYNLYSNPFEIVVQTYSASSLHLFALQQTFN